MDPITKKKTDRFRYLNALYDAVGGRQFTACQWVELGKEAGLTPQESTDVALYLNDEGLIDYSGQLVSLTHAGIKEIEYARTHPDEATEYFPPVVNIIHVGSMTNSQIQQGTVASSQSGTFSCADLASLKDALSSIVERIDRLQLSPERQKEMVSDIATLRAQLEAPAPKAGIVKELVRSVRAILEEGGGGVLAEIMTKYGPALAVFFQ
jgi:hypothetical protein